MEAPSEGRGRHGRQHSSSFGSQRGMPGSISRLARAISVKGRKPGENQMASSPSFNTLIEEALERPAPNLDPEKLINTFEDKLGLIQKMLKDYQNEGKKPDGEKQQKKIAAQAASVAGEAKGKNKKFTEEEAYKNDKIERRVKSAGAGASRALSERVQLYRTSPVARAELEERCAHHLKAKAEAEAHAAAERARTRDFIRTNRTCLQGEAGLRSLGEFAHTLPLPSRPATAGTRPSTAPLTTRDGLSTRADVQHMQPPQATSLAQEQQSAHGLHGLPRIRARPQTAFPHSHTEGARTPTSYWGDTPKTFLTHGDDSSREASPLSGGGGDDSDTEHPRPARTPQPARTAVSFERTHAPPASPIPPDPRTIPAHPPAAVHGGLLVPPRACQLHAPASGDTTLPQPTAYIPAEQVRVSPTANPPHAQGPSMSMSALAGHSRLPASPWLSHSGPLPSAASMVDPGSPRQQLQPAMSSVPSLSRHHAQSTRFAHSSSLAFQSCASRQTHQDQQDDMPDSPGVLADDQGLGAHMHGSMEGQGQSPNFSRVLAKVRALNALSQASRPPSRMTSTPKSTGDRSVFGPAGQCWEGSGQPEEPDLPEAAEMAEVERELRLLLTSRPGGGGSPTTRKRFNKQYKLLAQKREKQIEEARLRKEDLEAARRQRSQLEAKLRAEAEENERRQREQAQRKAELIQRHRTWLGTCNLASKLWFVADCVMKDREVHPIRELRRRAAITIAEWYRDVLQRRRWRQLLQLQLKLRQLLAPYLAAKQAQVRQRCGLRILHFCELHHRGAAESAVIAVKRFRRKLVVIQRAWRICLAVRAMQRMLLYNHLSKFEKTILTKAQREAEVEESAGRQRVKRPLTIRKTHTTPLHRDDLDRVTARKSAQTSFSFTHTHTQRGRTTPPQKMIRNLQFMFHGSKHFSKQAYVEKAKRFDQSILNRRLDNKVCVVTGANQGLGYAASEMLAKCGAVLYMVCRSEARGQEAVRKIREVSGSSTVHLRLCDVSSMQSLQKFAAEFEQEGLIHILIHNAGVLINEPQKSVDGFDANFATNMLGPFALTRMLEGVLKRSAPARVIFVSSGGMLTQPLDVDVKKSPSSWGYDGMAMYSKDKRRQVAIAEKLAEMWDPAGIKVVSMHPGWATTEGVKKSIPGFYKFYENKFRTPQEGADTIAYLALEDESKLVPGGFYLDREPTPKHLSMGGTQYTKADVKRLWDNLDALVAEATQKKAQEGQQ